MTYAKIVGWEKFQHYKDRNPPWIKLHRVILTSYRFARLPDVSKAHFYGLLLLASENNGLFPSDPDFLAEALHATEPVSLGPLVSAGLIRYVASCKQDDSNTLSFARSRETETEVETETETEKDTLVSQAAAEPPGREADRELRGLLGPAVRKLAPERTEQSRWMKWARDQHAAGKTLSELEAWLFGLVGLRDAGWFTKTKPKEPIGPGMFEACPDLRFECMSWFNRNLDTPRKALIAPRDGPTRLKIELEGGHDEADQAAGTGSVESVGCAVRGPAEAGTADAAVPRAAAREPPAQAAPRRTQGK